MNLVSQLLYIVSIILLTIVPVLLCVAFLTLAERKIMGAMQRRIGPSVWGFAGLLQPFLDGLKLVVKQPLLPSNSDAPLYVLAPSLTFIVSQIAWAAIPASALYNLCDLPLGAMYILAVSSMGVYGLLLAGWSSNSKYAFLGCLRSVAQMISYELGMSTVVLTVCLVAGSFSLSEIISSQELGWFLFALWPQAILFFICCLAETNRAPFDLSEAEAELVAGYLTEYASAGFALYFIAEYANMILMSALCAIFFLGGQSSPIPGDTILPGSFWLISKTMFFLFLFVWVRATLPRYRYDQLMRLGWKTIIPLTFGGFLLAASIIVSFST